MKTLHSPDLVGSSAGGRHTNAPKRDGSVTPEVVPDGETRSEHLLHELFRLTHLDSRANAHAARCVAELGKMIGLVLAWLAVVGPVRFALAGLLLVAGVVAGASWDALLTGGTLGLAVALDVQSFAIDAPGAGGKVLAAVTGDPNSIRNCPEGNRVQIIAAFSKAQGAGFTQITFPSGNDTTRNIRYANVANQPGNMLCRGIGQTVQPQEPLSLFEVGSAVVGDIELASVMVFYDSLPGVDSQLISPGDLSSRLVRLVTIQNSITATAASVYSAAQAINAGSDLLRANTQYALLGYKLGAACQCLTLRGPDTGNLRVAMPGLIAPDVETINWFVELSEWFSLPLIPTFNSANKTGTFIECLTDENLTAVPFSLLLAELTA
jgi:hypothetical protein